ncbi:serine hydrolase domain-containing protein [Fusibacter ferrireducens]|uniref:Serine hydrolase n=1 Tax=Fusibacter ferrireducens TaxID=2785058 RepID=A0ABR9ZT42_9FIRM|nr:serine hydrolase domain-containing protein [Fusibacter ferrireducens]MBF4693303.1 serine hydrolase [Fusibacter ferrireducens]
MKKFSILTLIGIIVMLQSLMSFADREDNSKEALENLIQVEMIQYNVPGIMVSIALDGTSRFETAMGMSDLSTQEKMSLKQTVVQTGSISKTFTAYALVEAMKLKGVQDEDLIGPYLSKAEIEAHPSFANLTFKNVLTHTTGQASVKAGTALNQHPSLNPDAIKVVGTFSDEADRFMKSYKFDTVVTPDSYSVYSNVNAVLAGILIESLTDMSYESYLSNIISKQFGMTVSGKMLKHEKIEEGQLISGYHVFGGVKTKTRGYQARLLPSDDFLTTMSDMSHFLNVLTADRNDVLVEKFLSRQIRNDELSSGRSYGFSIMNIEGHEVYFQDGGIPGVNARLLVVPKEKFAMFIVYNSDSTEFRSEMTSKLIKAYLGHKATEAKEGVAETALNKYIGAYTPLNASNETAEKLTQIIHQIRVMNKQDGLYIDKSKYVPYAQNSFFCKETQTYATFKLDDLGRLKYLIINNNIYRRTPFYQSLIVEIVLLIFTAFFNMLSLLVLISKWQNLKINRIHDTPRMIILIDTLVASALIGLILYAGMNYNSWDVIFNTMTVISWIKIFSVLGIVLIIPNWIMIQRGRADFRWTGLMIFIFRVQSILNILLLTWLWRYNLLKF